MKAKEITMQLVKNIGNYETVRMSATFDLHDDENIVESFVSAKRELEISFKEAFKEEMTVTTPKAVKTIIDEGSSEFIRVCKALNDKRTDMLELQKHYQFTTKALKYLFDNQLI